jgi:signal transduction histidine kinase
MQLNLGEYNLEEIIEEAVEFVRSVAAAKSVELKMQSGHWAIRCDRPKLLQTITNLVSNAIKFSPEGEAVCIDVAEFPHAVQLSVTDRGPGVPEQFQERIFEAFEQVPATAKAGTGLGLAICKLIVEAHNGSIGVSAVGSEARRQDAGSNACLGSRFWFRIPK